MHFDSFGRRVALSALGALVPLFAGSIASASLILTVNGVPITDNGSGDSNPLSDHITYIQTIAGNYSVDIQVGMSNDPGTSKQGLLSLNSTVTRTGTGGVIPLTIVLTDNGFALPVSNLYTLTSSYSGSLTPHGNSSSQSFVSNVASPSVSTPTQGFSAGPLLPPGISSQSSSSTFSTSFASLSHPYAMTETAVFNLGPLASARLNAQTILTPEPATLGLLGVGSVGLLRRRRN